MKIFGLIGVLIIVSLDLTEREREKGKKKEERDQSEYAKRLCKEREDGKEHALESSRSREIERKRKACGPVCLCLQALVFQMQGKPQFSFLVCPLRY